MDSLSKFKKKSELTRAQYLTDRGLTLVITVISLINNNRADARWVFKGSVFLKKLAANCNYLDVRRHD